MELVTPMTSWDVAEWVKCRRRGGEELSWWGKGAEALGLTGEADYATALHLLRDGVGPGGEEIATPDACACEQTRDRPPGESVITSYVVRFCPHESIDELQAEYREAVLEAHGVAVAEALRVLEAFMRLGLAGVVATIDYGRSAFGYWPRRTRPMVVSEALFAASGLTPRGDDWRPLGTLGSVFYKVQPSVGMGFTKYHERLSEEIERLIGVDIDCEPLDFTGIPVAVTRH